jgi:hypothetical protein
VAAGGVPRSVGTPLVFSDARGDEMATREELLKEIGDLAHHNEKTYFG